jgi:hypothetical protein
LAGKRCYLARNLVQEVQVMPTADKRLIFWGGSREVNNDGKKNSQAMADNSAFQFAANNVKRDYDDWGRASRIIKITTAADMLATINASEAGSLLSLDILSHGTPWSLNFSIRNDMNCGLFASRSTRTSASISSPFSSQINTPDADSRVVSDINFNVFSNEAIIELHGCQTAGRGIVFDNIATNISEGLSDAGKKLGVVIAHTLKANPNINGTTSVRAQDYRHGPRVIVHNGTIVHRFTRSGRIRPADAARYIS